MLKTLSINKLTTIGFSLIIIVFLIIGSICLLEISKLHHISKQISSLRAPTSKASSLLANQINQTLASLRDWMLFADINFDKVLRDSWIKIRTTEAEMKQLSEHWTNPENQIRFKKINALLNDLEKTQFSILKVSGQPENIPAIQVVDKELAPLALLLTDSTIHLINIEESLETTQERRALLIALTKFHNSLDTTLDNINAYLSSGNENFIHNYEKSWTENEQYFDRLKNMKSIFGPYQKRLFEDMIKNRESLSKLPEKIFQLRKQANWNQAKFLLKTKVEPLSQQIIQLLDDMVENQHQLLQLDNEAMTVSTSNFKSIVIFIIFLAILFTTWLGLIVNRRSSEAQSHINYRAMLIDQNIMMAYLDNNGVIIDISNNLCRALNGVKTDFIGQQSYFFLAEKDTNPLFSAITKTIQTGKEWEGEIETTTTENEKIWFYSKLIPSFYSKLTPTLTNSDNSDGYTNILQSITNKKRLEEISITDKLTALFNRRHFDTVIEQQIKLARRNAIPITLCILDIDFFKEYNDYYGHQAGDNALAQIAHTLKENLKRPDDYVFRLGGEEFGIIFNGLDCAHVQEILKKIQQSIEALQIEHQRSKVHDYLTLSIGAKVCISTMNLKTDDFYLTADKALYEAKKKRNCVVIE